MYLLSCQKWNKWTGSTSCKSAFTSRSTEPTLRRSKYHYLFGKALHRNVMVLLDYKRAVRYLPAQTLPSSSTSWRNGQVISKVIITKLSKKKIPEGKKMIKSFIFPKVPGNTYFPEEQRGRTSQRFQTQINSTDSTSIIFWNYIQIWLSLRILPKASWHSSVSMLQKHTLMQPLYMTDSSHRISDILHFQYVKWLYFYIRNFARDLFSFREVTKPSWLFFS